MHHRLYRMLPPSPKNGCNFSAKECTIAQTDDPQQMALGWSDALNRWCSSPTLPVRAQVVLEQK